MGNKSNNTNNNNKNKDNNRKKDKNNISFTLCPLIDERKLWDLLVQSLSGLLYLHENKKIIHRDLI